MTKLNDFVKTSLVIAMTILTINIFASFTQITTNYFTNTASQISVMASLNYVPDSIVEQNGKDIGIITLIIQIILLAALVIIFVKVKRAQILMTSNLLQPKIVKNRFKPTKILVKKIKSSPRTITVKPIKKRKNL